MVRWVRWVSGMWCVRLVVGAVVALVMAGGARAAVDHEVEPAPVGLCDDVPLIPRDVLFANPDRAQVRLSPDGKWVSYLAPFDGVLNVWIQPADGFAAGSAPAKPVTLDRGQGVRRHWWTYSGRHILYAQDANGDENWQLMAVDIHGGTTTALTPAGAQARIVAILPNLPGQVLVSLNDRDPTLHDLHSIDLSTGEDRLVRIAPPNASDWVVDFNGTVRFVERATPDGGLEFLMPLADGGWGPGFVVPAEDAVTTRVLGFGADPGKLYLSDSRGRDTAALVRLDLVTGDAKVLAENPRADLDEVTSDPRTGEVHAASFVEGRREWTPLCDCVDKDLAFLRQVQDGDVWIITRTLDDRRWLVSYHEDDGPVAFYLYERGSAERGVGPRVRFLFFHRDRLSDVRLAPMRTVRIMASDGLELSGYLTLPLGSEDAAGEIVAGVGGVEPALDGGGDAARAWRRPGVPLPMVLLVHGGPWARDAWGFNPLHQLLANRGYAVLSVNFRGSTGFGKAFVNAGDREWGGRIQQDLTEATRWAIDQGIADADRVAIMGGSFGGYAAQCGMAMTPDLFACGVSAVGPSDLTTLLESIPAYWAPMRAFFARRVGDISTPAGREFLLSRSPLTHAGAIRRPMLLVHGANDPRVKLAESQRMAATLEQNGIEVTLVVFPDEGHGLARPENNLAFIALAEGFLAQHLGGRYQPADGQVERSSAVVRRGEATQKQRPGDTK